MATHKSKIAGIHFETSTSYSKKYLSVVHHSGELVINLAGPYRLLKDAMQAAETALSKVDWSGRPDEISQSKEHYSAYTRARAAIEYK